MTAVEAQVGGQEPGGEVFMAEQEQSHLREALGAVTGFALKHFGLVRSEPLEVSEQINHTRRNRLNDLPENLPR